MSGAGGLPPGAGPAGGDGDPDDVLAAELVLRVLEPAEALAARRRAAFDEAFAARVAAWEGRLAGLLDEVEEVRPSPAARRAVMERAFGREPDGSGVGWFAGALAGALGGLALAAVALVAAVLAGLVTLPRGGAPVAAAEIASAETGFRAVATLDVAAGLVHVVRLEGEAPEGRVLQLWGHAPEDPVVSLGVLPEGPTASLPLPAGVVPPSGVFLFGISEEPPGGSTTGAPSGEVLANGQIDAL